jgi:hypothetical protein
LTPDSKLQVPGPAAQVTHVIGATA